MARTASRTGAGLTLLIALAGSTTGWGQVCEGANKPGPDARLTFRPGYSGEPSLTNRPGGHALAWQDDGDGDDEIYVSLLDAAGNNVGSDVRVTVDPWTAGFPSIAATSDGFGVVWQDDRDGHDQIYFARLDSAGNKLGNDVRVTVTPYVAARPALVWTGSEFGLGWEERRGGVFAIYFTRLDVDGNRVGAEVPVSASPSRAEIPALAWTGDGYGVAWHDFRDDNFEIYFARLDAEGAKIGEDLRVTQWTSGSYYASLTWTGTGFGVAWYDYRDGNSEVYFALLDASGAKVGTDVRVTEDAGSSYFPRLAWSGGEFGVVFEDTRSGVDEVWFARIGAGGQEVGAEFQVSDGPSRSEVPALAWNSGAGWRLVWQDGRDGDTEVYRGAVACCFDGDADTWTTCTGDCDDANAAVHPGAGESCNALDDDCNGTVDDGFPVPGGVAGLLLDSDEQGLRWDAAASADRYDVVRGDLASLLSGAGDFAGSLSACVQDDASGTSASDPWAPATGAGAYYTVRAQAACRNGSYDDPAGAGQQGGRDAGIGNSSAGCP